LLLQEGVKRAYAKTSDILMLDEGGNSINIGGPVGMARHEIPFFALHRFSVPHRFSAPDCFSAPVRFSVPRRFVFPVYDYCRKIAFDQSLNVSRRCLAV
jgi:hypothetical protein